MDGVPVAGFSFARVRSAVVGAMGSVVELQVLFCSILCTVSFVHMAHDASAVASRLRRRFSSSFCSSLLSRRSVIQWLVFNGKRKVE